MLHLRVYGSSDKLDEIGKGLEDDGRARHVAMSQGVREGYVLLTAEVDGASADWVLDYLSAHGVAKEDIALSRLDDVGDIPKGRPVAALIWADVLGQARQNARPVARFLIFMIAAGVIASFGVIVCESDPDRRGDGGESRHPADSRHLHRHSSVSAWAWPGAPS